MNSTDQKISAMRKMMAQDKVDAVIIPSNDPHNSEYVAEHWQARKWLTGFDGSAGTAVITKDTAVLWTDSRYYLQAEEQIKGSEFELFKQGKPDVPDVAQWLGDVLESGSVAGFDARMLGVKWVRKLEKQLQSGVSIKRDITYVDQLWEHRPPMPASKAWLFSKDYAGKSCKEKLGLIREKMRKYSADYHLITTLDDIAWTLNLRGSDVEYNPVNISYLLIGKNEAVLFVNEEKLSGSVKKALQQDGVWILPYEDVEKKIQGLPERSSILVDPDQVNYQLYACMNNQFQVLEKPGPAVGLKAVKNKIEISHMQKTAAVDGAAVVKFLYWLENRDVSKPATEYSAAQVLCDFRKENDLFVDESFAPIMAWADHSAIVHYSADKEKSYEIGTNGVLLADTGGNYLTGTTDITRTIGIGSQKSEVIRDYTLVLKGHIAVARVIFPYGTKGYQIDTLARQYLWQEGKDFGHGTGHGVGFFLCVHEGPARISPHPSQINLESGMMLTNEPGIYRQQSHGIRLENMILVEDAFENESGRFLKFSNLTWCHFERDMIEISLLDEAEIQYLNQYHQQVFDKVGPYLDANQEKWLAVKTRPL